MTVLGAAACVAEIDAADDEANVVREQGSSEKAPVVLWSPAFPTNPNGSAAAETVVDSVAMGGCKYSSVVHRVGFRSLVGIKVESILTGSCELATVLGGKGYLTQGIYNGPYAYARLQKFVPAGRLVFVSSGSSGSKGAEQATLSTLNVALIDARSGVTLRKTTQDVCATKQGAQIAPDGAIQVIGQSGMLAIAGTKNASTALPGEGACAKGPYLRSFTLGYAGFATGDGPVPPPSIQ